MPAAWPASAIGSMASTASSRHGRRGCRPQHRPGEDRHERDRHRGPQRRRAGVEVLQADDQPVRADRVADALTGGVGVTQRDERERGERPDDRAAGGRLRTAVAADVEPAVPGRRGQQHCGHQPADGDRAGDVEDRTHGRQAQVDERPGVPAGELGQGVRRAAPRTGRPRRIPRSGSRPAATRRHRPVLRCRAGRRVGGRRCTHDLRVLTATDPARVICGSRTAVAVRSYPVADRMPERWPVAHPVTSSREAPCPH